MPFKLYPPAGVTIDLTKGLEAAERVFAANGTKAEIAIFGYEVALKFKERRRMNRPDELELRLAEVFALAAGSAYEACTGMSNPPDGWTCGVTVPDEVYLWAPGASLDAHQRGVDAARAVFRVAGISPQLAAMGDWEQQVREIRGHKGPDLSEEACRGAEVFYDADRASRETAGNIPGSHMRVDGFDAPEWKEYMASSAVLNWQQESEATTG